MSVLDVLDATRLCQPLVDPAAWNIAPPAPPRREPPAPRRPEFSWWSLVRNPQALLLSGVIAAGLVQDALVRVVDLTTPSPRPTRAPGW